MRSLFVTSAAVIGFLLMGLGAQAQDRYRDDDRYYRDDRYRPEPLNRVRADLNRASRDMGYLSRSEFHRVEHANEEIGEFQRKWERGHFDKGELDDVIGSLQKVVDKNRLEPRDRDLLVDDLFRLRDFRARYRHL
jgi:hypothetical protein